MTFTGMGFGSPIVSLLIVSEAKFGQEPQFVRFFWICFETDS